MRTFVLAAFLATSVLTSGLRAQAPLALPFLADFETGPGGFTVEGTTSFAHGVPTGAVINTAASGSFAWVTNPSGLHAANENGAIRSPTFDFTTAVNPYVRMKIWWNCEADFDGLNLQYSTDGGLSWVTVGGFGDQVLWYNAASIVAAPGGDAPGWSGRNLTLNGSGGWAATEHDLWALAGAPSVQFRLSFASDGSVQDDGVAIDDFSVFDAVVPFPGSHEDLRVITGVGGFEDDSLGSEIKAAPLGAPVTVRIVSPEGTYTNAPFVLLADMYSTLVGYPIKISPINFPEVHVSSSVVVAVNGYASAGAFGLYWVIGPAGTTLNFSVLDPGLAGLGVLIQGMVVTNTARNGFFAISDGRVFTF
ncbi:MAG: hypothetical protein R3F20_03790 [Planctomycetota bacterium]